MDWKQTLWALLLPEAWTLIGLTLLCAAGLVWVFAAGLTMHPLAYGLYVLSFYTLTVDCIRLSRVLPEAWRRGKGWLNADPRRQRYLSDRRLRARTSLYLSLAASVSYVAMNLLSWYLNRSWWFVILAGYYSILSLMRLLMVRYDRRHALGDELLAEWRRARTCACMLLLVNLTLSAAVLMILYQDRGYDYPGVLIYVMALHTFYSVIHAAVDGFRFRRMDSPILSTAKVISLCTAMVSMLNLETAMFSQFGADMPLAHQRLMIALTGALVSIVVVTLSTLLILRSTKEVRRLAHEPA